jgi:hypothetical protein
VETEFSNLRNARNNDDLAEAVRAFTHRVTNLLEVLLFSPLLARSVSSL